MILLTTRTHTPSAFLGSDPRMNVACTRSRRGLVVVGSRSALQNVGFFKQLSQAVDRHGVE